VSGTQRFELSGVRLCLDFANTVDNRPTPSRRDLLATYDDLVAWSRQAAVLDDREAEALQAVARRRPRQARRVLGEARRLREALYRVFSAIAAGFRPESADLDALNDRLPALLARSRLVRTPQGYAWRYSGAADRLDRMLWAVLQSALGLLLAEDELPRLRECASATCSWLFMDRSKSRRRRWCNMQVCGNRAKVRRFRDRQSKKAPRRKAQATGNGG
jgi:predicted RNA-binding Zn ribbon-like protein